MGNEHVQETGASAAGNYREFATSELASRLQRLIDSRGIEPFFQPILRLEDRQIVGYELLARSKFDRLTTPAELFRAAECVNMAAVVSELCRSVGYEVEAGLPPGAKLFVNVHPSEPLLTGLLPSLRRMRRATNRPVVVEIHEAAVTDPATLDEFAAAARDIQVELAFDDFGIGRARMLEFARRPPDYVKFDLQLIRNMHQQPPHHATVLKHLVNMMLELKCLLVAEGVETERDADNCRAYGFHLAQGYLFGRPAPVSDTV